MMKRFNLPNKRQSTLIFEFEVIKPKHEIEKIGEVLKLSQFGEYCPDSSLRGYDLKYLISNPLNYKIKTIIQRGKLININE